MIRELRRSWCKVQLDRSTSSHYIRWLQSLVQGCPSATVVVNAALDLPASEFVDLAKSNDWGLRIDSALHLLSLICFADDFWLHARSPNELQDMLQAWLSILRKYGWHSPVNEITWASTGEDNCGCCVTVDNTVVPRAPRDEGFVALRVNVSPNGRVTRELYARIQKALGSLSCKSGLPSRILGSVAPTRSLFKCCWSPYSCFGAGVAGASLTTK